MAIVTRSRSIFQLRNLPDLVIGQISSFLTASDRDKLSLADKKHLKLVHDSAVRDDSKEATNWQTMHLIYSVLRARGVYDAFSPLRESIDLGNNGIQSYIRRFWKMLQVRTNRHLTNKEVFQFEIWGENPDWRGMAIRGIALNNIRMDSALGIAAKNFALIEVIDALLVNDFDTEYSVNNNDNLTWLAGQYPQSVELIFDRFRFRVRSDLYNEQFANVFNNFIEFAASPYARRSKRIIDWLYQTLPSLDVAIIFNALSAHSQSLSHDQYKTVVKYLYQHPNLSGILKETTNSSSIKNFVTNSSKSQQEMLLKQLRLWSKDFDAPLETSILLFCKAVLWAQLMSHIQLPYLKLNWKTFYNVLKVVIAELGNKSNAFTESFENIFCYKLSLSQKNALINFAFKRYVESNSVIDLQCLLRIAKYQPHLMGPKLRSELMIQALLVLTQERHTIEMLELLELIAPYCDKNQKAFLLQRMHLCPSSDTKSQALTIKIYFNLAAHASYSQLKHIARKLQEFSYESNIYIANAPKLTVSEQRQYNNAFISFAAQYERLAYFIKSELICNYLDSASNKMKKDLLSLINRALHRDPLLNAHTAVACVNVSSSVLNNIDTFFDYSCLESALWILDYDTDLNSRGSQRLDALHRAMYGEFNEYDFCYGLKFAGFSKLYIKLLACAPSSVHDEVLSRFKKALRHPNAEVVNTAVKDLLGGMGTLEEPMQSKVFQLLMDMLEKDKIKPDKFIGSFNFNASLSKNEVFYKYLMVLRAYSELPDINLNESLGALDVIMANMSKRYLKDYTALAIRLVDAYIHSKNQYYLDVLVPIVTNGTDQERQNIYENYLKPGLTGSNIVRFVSVSSYLTIELIHYLNDQQLRYVKEKIESTRPQFVNEERVEIFDMIFNLISQYLEQYSKRKSETKFLKYDSSLVPLFKRAYSLAKEQEQNGSAPQSTMRLAARG